MCCKQHQKLSISEDRVILFFFYNRNQFLLAPCLAFGLILLIFQMDEGVSFRRNWEISLVVAEIELKRENK